MLYRSGSLEFRECLRVRRKMPRVEWCFGQYTVEECGRPGISVFVEEEDKFVNSECRLPGEQAVSDGD